MDPGKKLSLQQLSSRLAAAEDSNELKENTIRDIPQHSQASIS